MIYDHLRNIDLLKNSEGDSTSIDLFIGNDFYYSFINSNIVKGQKDESIAMETYLGGFILSAVFIDENSNKESLINFNSTHVLRITAEGHLVNNYKEKKRIYEDELKRQSNEFWETEIVGFTDFIENDKLMKQFKDELKFKSTRYCVKLAYREHH